MLNADTSIMTNTEKQKHVITMYVNNKFNITFMMHLSMHEVLKSITDCFTCILN